MLLRGEPARPEIIQDLELARHGLEILPLESTFTPLPNDDYLVRWADHDRPGASSTGTLRATPTRTTSSAS